MKGLAISTSFTVALITVIMLKILDFFHFIKWDPVGFSDTFHVLKDSNTFIKWVILFIVVWAASIILYYISLIFMKIPIAITSIALGLIIAFILEWIILDASTIEKTIKRMSIPFICIIIVATRFLMESAIFHAQDKPLSK
ncbi:hypothetical protein [Psychrobacillus lasiicapitis]|uniref:Uncharacterized protein n=1 Tax=Psychrobacillus lasiicapitis TaxID=1636719 RepID=A0A544TAL3_9BACI|nr:hypothetical protein [Psychrobacillus lasiicapitis]TQR14504.1 hypothetical protein FG382_08595 [Psychrobacillus lasiicapitis]GGA30782.1 hypothetical protein GCM10011384_20330 [Psychrobacillus lasiicapitis]